MKERAQQPHGQKEIRRQNDEEQTSGKVYRPGPELAHRKDDAQRRPAVGHQIHDGDGVELHGQHLHGDLPKALGLLLHLLLLAAVGLVDLQGGQALQVLQERVPQGGVLAPVFGQELLGPPLYRHNGQGDQGHAEEQHHRRRETDRGQHGKQGQGRQHGVEELGQVRAEIGLQLVDALHRHLHHLGGVHLLLVRGPQCQQLSVEPLPQGALYRPGGAEAHAIGKQGAGSPHRQGHGGHAQGEERSPSLRQARCQGRQQLGHRPQQGDIRQQRHPLAQHVPRDVLPALRHRGDQSFVDHPSILPQGQVVATNHLVQ